MDKESQKPYKAYKVWIMAFHAALGSFIFSYNIGVFTSNQPCVAATLGWGGDKDVYIAVFSSFLPLGAMFGALGSGYFSKFIGRRKNLIIADLIIITAAIITVIPFTVTFGAGRFLSGIGIGNFSVLCPLYINEITPVDISGKVGTMVMLFGSMGSLFAFSFALALPTSNYDSDPQNYVWMAMFLFQGVVALFQLTFFLIAFPHETPPWLLNRGHREEALESLTTVYNKSYADGLLEKMLNSTNVTSSPTEAEDQNKDYTYRQIFSCRRGTTKAMRLGLLLSIIQQFAGINAILSYATTIFGKFGGGVFMSRVFTMLSGVVKFVSVFALIPLIDRVGRKAILVYGCIGMGICLAAMGVMSVYQVYYVIPFLCIELYLGIFVCSIGPICWIYSSEILPSRGMSICTGVNWFSAFLVVLFFPFSLKAIGITYTFWIFAIVNISGAAYFALDMVETKGMRKNDIRLLLSSKR